MKQTKNCGISKETTLSYLAEPTEHRIYQTHQRCNAELFPISKHGDQGSNSHCQAARGPEINKPLCCSKT